GDRQFQFAGSATNYYVLYSGDTVMGVTNPIQMVFGAQPMTSMLDASAQQAAAYYLVQSIPTNAPLDLDGDGANDVLELLNGTNPLKPEKASLVINEVNPNIGSSHDLIELLVTTNGYTSGYTVEQGISSVIVLATLPTIDAAANDLILVHLSPTM